MVKVTVINPEYARKGVWMFEQPQFFEYEGNEVQVKHCTVDQLALTTGNPEWPIRIIQRGRIVKIDGSPVAPLQSATVTRVVKGSRGDEYTVTGANGKWNCTCPGFQFRRSCKHTSEAQL